MKRKSPKRTRRKFSKEEKLAAIERYENGEVIDLNLNVVRRWRDEWHKYGANAFSGYGNPRTPTPQKTQPIVFRLKLAEHERLLAGIQTSQARSLSEFVRGHLFEVQPEAGQIEQRVAELTRVVEGLARMIAET